MRLLLYHNKFLGTTTLTVAMTRISITVPFLIVSIICMVIIPCILGRWVGLVRIFIRSKTNSPSSVSFITSTNPTNSDTTIMSSDQQHAGYNNQVNATISQEHLPSWTCQSLGIDVDMIDPNLLQSPNQMENMIMKIISDDSLFISSPILTNPRCYSIISIASSNVNRLQCDTSLSNSHLHIYTWPQSGSMSIDVFSCTHETLLSIIPTIKRLIGIVPPYQPNHTAKSMLRWEYKLRGERWLEQHSVFTDGDINQFLHGFIDFDMKELITSVETEYQAVDIYDTINPRFKSLEQYHASLQSDRSYYSLHPELFRPDRVIYLDGIMQSRLYGDAAYHEALVHPALFTHPNPQRVAIIGGGEGATLREVLKHNTIVTVTMIEIDEQMVNISRQYLPEWSDCSTIINSAPSCFDDPRAEIYYTDAIAWFIERYRNIDNIDTSQLFDVIIMDALYVMFDIYIAFHIVFGPHLIDA
jgi:Spermine/spermidine synthase domain/S-adenosylmethionine decarboxylase